MEAAGRGFPASLSGAAAFLLREPEKRAKPGFVEAGDGLPVDHCPKGGYEPQLFQHVESRRGLTDVPLPEGDAVLRKELFRLLAEQSAGVRVHDHLS